MFSCHLLGQHFLVVHTMHTQLCWGANILIDQVGAHTLPNPNAPIFLVATHAHTFSFLRLLSSSSSSFHDSKKYLVIYRRPFLREFVFCWHWVILQYSKLKFQFHFLFDNLGNEVDNGHFLLDSNNFRCLRYFTKVFKDWLSFCYEEEEAKKSFHTLVRSLKFTLHLLRPLAKKFSKFTKSLLRTHTFAFSCNFSFEQSCPIVVAHQINLSSLPATTSSITAFLSTHSFHISICL